MSLAFVFKYTKLFDLRGFFSRKKDLDKYYTNLAIHHKYFCVFAEQLLYNSFVTTKRGRLFITTRNEVGARLCFHRRV